MANAIYGAPILGFACANALSELRLFVYGRDSEVLLI